MCAPEAPSEISQEVDAAGSHRGQVARDDKAMTREEVSAFLASAYCGRTGSVDADGYPYVTPNLYVWMDDKVYLHTARRPGHFLANVRHSDRACFEIDAPGDVFPYGHVECDTSVAYASVVLFGRIRVVDDEQDKIRFFEAFMTKYAPADSWGREQNSFPRVAATIVYVIEPEVMTGKRAQLPAVSDQWPSRNATLSPTWTPQGSS